MRRLLTKWPTPITFCGSELGEALPYRGSAIEQDFSWTTAHPVADFYRSYKPMPYDAPSQHLAAVPPRRVLMPACFKRGTESIEVLDDGGLRFAANPAGKHKRLTMDPRAKIKYWQRCERSESRNLFHRLLARDSLRKSSRSWKKRVRKNRRSAIYWTKSLVSHGRRLRPIPFRLSTDLSLTSVLVS